MSAPITVPYQPTCRRWYYSADNHCIGSHELGLSVPAWFDANKRSAFYHDHPGFPGVVVSGDDDNGEPCIFPPVPGRDFVPSAV